MLLFSGDRSGLGHRRLHHRARVVGLPAGTDRRRDDPGRLRRWARSSAAGSVRWCSPRAPSPPTRRSARPSGALLAGALVAVAVESFALGLRARVIRRPALHLADGAGGAALIAAVALGLAWVFGAVALHAPGTARLRADVQESVILRSLNEVLPPSGPVLNALDRVDPAPSITGPAAPVARPDAAIATDPDVLNAGGSVVRVLGTACGLGVEGSGWAVQPGPDRHQRPRRRRLRATPRSRPRAGSSSTRRPSTTTPRTTWRCCGSAPTCRRCRSPSVASRAPTPPSSATRRTVPTRSRRPASARPVRRSARTPTATGRSTARSWRCGGSVRSGNSGGPLVDAQGQVVGTVFAATTSGSPGGFAIPAEDVRDAVTQAPSAVSTGACTG